MSSDLRFEIVPLENVPVEDETLDTNAHPTVLVVDDEKVIADTLSIILTKNGFTTMTAYDGESALRMAAKTQPDLLLSDVMMGPGIDGSELAMAVVNMYPQCKVLLFSGHSSTRDLLAKASNAGHSFTLLSKPLHPADLLERLKDTFHTPAGYAMAQQPPPASVDRRFSQWS
jgi:CheY-like chemotaxis protein